MPPKPNVSAGTQLKANVGPFAPRLRCEAGGLMRRREFITLIGSAAAWPIVTLAQQPAQMRRVGALLNLKADDPLAQIEMAGFVGGLQERGWTVGGTLQRKAASRSCIAN